MKMMVIYLGKSKWYKFENILFYRHLLKIKKYQEGRRTVQVDHGSLTPCNSSTMTYSKTKAFIQEQVYHGSQTPCNSITMTYSKTNTFLEEQIYHVYLDQPTGAHRLQAGRRQTQGMNAVLGPAAQVRLQRLEDQCIPRGTNIPWVPRPAP